MPAKPSFVFIPGAWHCTTTFRPVTSRLEALGYRTQCVQLPSFGADPPLADFRPDVAAAREAIERAADRGDDVVLFMHSYGGLVGCEACRDLDRTTRRAAGRAGGVIRLVFCAAFMAPEGTSLSDLFRGQAMPWFVVSDDGMVVKPTNPQDIFYNDFEQDAAREAALRLKCHSYRTFFSKATYAAWRDVPVTYIVCEQDHAVPAVAQELMIAGSGVDVVVERMDAGHSPFMNKPDLVTQVLRRSAGEIN
ncbi:Methylesterase 10 [Colletotrichum sidae]|uniref:Methylesterase 10 n=1 Tax=Colletotrichum sidae TaxID=1347389 RepID=A0A4R8TS44_9PEZI|nr:Methylesterase 10 [Colletotrichum sidae]